MTQPAKSFRPLILAVILALGVYGALASAARTGAHTYPNGQFLATGAWLKAHAKDPGVVVVDVRGDKDFDGRVIPGAVRMPWGQFQAPDTARGINAVFVGPAAAQEILGKHGISRTDTVVLYDSVKRDGGATSSYVFWVLDLLGHKNKKLLERGIDGWVDAGGQTADAPRTAEPVLYQAPSDEIQLNRWATGAFVQSRLGDPHYQIIDVRSREEYLGEKPNASLAGGPLKLGHVPTAINVDYTTNWADKETKAFKPQAELLQNYRGVNGAATLIPYCHSGRRASFVYFVLRLMGFDNVSLFEGSWNEWGSTDLFYPVETEERKPAGDALPVPGKRADAGAVRTGVKGGEAKGGYVSCGG